MLLFQLRAGLPFYSIKYSHANGIGSPTKSPTHLRQSLRHSVCRRWQRLWFGIECESATSFLHIVILRIKDASFSFLLIGVWSMKRNTSINGLPGFVISILLPNTSIIGEEPHRLIFQTWLSSSQNSWKYYYSISFSPFQDDQRAASCMFRRESNHYSQTIRIWLC